MDTNKMRDISREQFEVRYPVPKGCCWNAEQGRYVLFHLKLCTVAKYERFVESWVCWQASREAVVVELGAPSHWVADYAACGGGMTVFDAEKATKVTDPMCSKTPSYTIHALEKAGLKVAP